MIHYAPSTRFTVEEHGYGAIPPSKELYCHFPISEVDSFLNEPVSSPELLLQHQVSQNTLCLCNGLCKLHK